MSSDDLDLSAIAAFGACSVVARARIDVRIVWGFAPLLLLLTGCGASLPPRDTHPCAMIEVHERSAFGWVFEVEVFARGEVRVKFRGAEEARQVPPQDAERICEMLSVLGHGEYEKLLLYEGDYNLDAGGLPLVTASFDGERSFAFSTWDEELVTLLSSDFGRGICELDRILLDKFQCIYCFDSQCEVTGLSLVFPPEGFCATDEGL